MDKLVLCNYPPQFPPEVNELGPLASISCSDVDVYVLNEINNFHANFLYGKEPFTTKDNLVKFDDFMNFYFVLKSATEKLKKIHLQKQAMASSIQSQQQQQRMPLPPKVNITQQLKNTIPTPTNPLSIKIQQQSQNNQLVSQTKNQTNFPTSNDLSQGSNNYFIKPVFTNQIQAGNRQLVPEQQQIRINNNSVHQQSVSVNPQQSIRMQPDPTNRINIINNNAINPVVSNQVINTFSQEQQLRHQLQQNRLVNNNNSQQNIITPMPTVTTQQQQIYTITTVMNQPPNITAASHQQQQQHISYINQQQQYYLQQKQYEFYYQQQQIQRCVQPHHFQPPQYTTQNSPQQLIPVPVHITMQANTNVQLQLQAQSFNNSSNHTNPSDKRVPISTTATETILSVTSINNEANINPEPSVVLNIPSPIQPQSTVAEKANEIQTIIEEPVVASTSTQSKTIELTQNEEINTEQIESVASSTITNSEPTEEIAASNVSNINEALSKLNESISLNEEIEIIYEPKYTGGWLQINDTMVPYIDLPDYMFKLTERFVHSKKYAPLEMLIERNILDGNHMLTTTISPTEEHIDYLNTLVYNLDKKDDKTFKFGEDKLINVYEVIYESTKINFLKKLSLIHPKMHVFKDFSKITVLRGGLLLSNKNIIPFVTYKNKKIVPQGCMSSFLSKYLETKNSLEFKTSSTETLWFKEFYEMIVCFVCIEQKFPKNLRLLDITSLYEMYPGDFKMLCEFTEKFPLDWKYSIRKFITNSSRSSQKNVSSATNNSNTNSQSVILNDKHDKTKETSTKDLSNNINDSSKNEKIKDKDATTSNSKQTSSVINTEITTMPLIATTKNSTQSLVSFESKQTSDSSTTVTKTCSIAQPNIPISEKTATVNLIKANYSSINKLLTSTERLNTVISSTTPIIEATSDTSNLKTNLSTSQTKEDGNISKPTTATEQSTSKIAETGKKVPSKSSIIPEEINTFKLSENTSTKIVQEQSSPQSIVNSKSSPPVLISSTTLTSSNPNKNDQSNNKQPPKLISIAEFQHAEKIFCRIQQVRSLSETSNDNHTNKRTENDVNVAKLSSSDLYSSIVEADDENDPVKKLLNNDSKTEKKEVLKKSKDMNNNMMSNDKNVKKNAKKKKHIDAMKVFNRKLEKADSKKIENSENIEDCIINTLIRSPKYHKTICEIVKQRRLNQDNFNAENQINKINSIVEDNISSSKSLEEDQKDFTVSNINSNLKVKKISSKANTKRKNENEYYYDPDFGLSGSRRLSFSSNTTKSSDSIKNAKRKRFEEFDDSNDSYQNKNEGLSSCYSSDNDSNSYNLRFRNSKLRNQFKLNPFINCTDTSYLTKITALNNLDIFTSEAFDQEFYLKKYNIKPCRVIVKKFIP